MFLISNYYVIVSLLIVRTLFKNPTIKFAVGYNRTRTEQSPNFYNKNTY